MCRYSLCHAWTCPVCGTHVYPFQHHDRNPVLITDLQGARDEIQQLKRRLRKTAQILIEQFGAPGPMNAEEAAQRAVDIHRAMIRDNTHHAVIHGSYTYKPDGEQV